MTEFELGYIAGFMDGEGSVCLTRRSRSKWRSPCISISNNDRNILQSIVATLSLSGSIVPKKTRKANHITNYDLRIVNDDALTFCAMLVDWVKHPVKKSRMQFLLDGYKDVTVRNGKYTVEQELAKSTFEARFFAL